MEMASYIYSILKSQINILYSWGFNSPIALQNGLKFKVQGFIHKGWVVVNYNRGTDLFDVSLYNYQMENKKEIESVYFDELVNIIDNAVENVQNYEDRVKQEYSMIF